MLPHDALLDRACAALARQGMADAALATLRAHLAGRRFGPGNWHVVRDLPTGLPRETFGAVWRRLHPGHRRPARGHELARGVVRAMQQGRPYDGTITDAQACPETGADMLALLRAAVRGRV